MPDQRIQAIEKLGGADHPSLTDTLNRAKLVGHENTGQHKVSSLIEAYLAVFPNFGIVLGGYDPPTEEQVAALIEMGITPLHIFWSPTGEGITDEFGNPITDSIDEVIKSE